MKLRFTRQAAQDLSHIADYIRERNPAAGRRVRSAIISSLQVLVLFPRIGRLQTTKGVRKLVTRRYPHVVYYTVDETDEQIVILTIQHPAREREHSDV
jgi:toxin ParE1/3/4